MQNNISIWMVSCLIQCIKVSCYFNLQVLGMPPNDFVQSASRRRLFFGENLCLPSFRSFFVLFFLWILICCAVYYVGYTAGYRVGLLDVIRK